MVLPMFTLTLLVLAVRWPLSWEILQDTSKEITSMTSPGHVTEDTPGHKTRHNLWSDIEAAFRFLEVESPNQDLSQTVQDYVRRNTASVKTRNPPFVGHNFIRFGKRKARYQPTTNVHTSQIGGNVTKGLLDAFNKHCYHDLLCGVKWLPPKDYSVSVSSDGSAKTSFALAAGRKRSKDNFVRIGKRNFKEGNVHYMDDYSALITLNKTMSDTLDNGEHSSVVGSNKRQLAYGLQFSDLQESTETATQTHFIPKWYSSKNIRFKLKDNKKNMHIKVKNVAYKLLKRKGDKKTQHSRHH